MESSLIPAEPAVPVAPYLGGKRRLASRIIERLGAIPHTLYCEPFVGMAGVFLRRPFKARSEVINDISGDVVCLFRVLQRHYEALMDMLKWQVTSRDQFERLRVANPETLTDLERATRFLYLQRLRFGGRPDGLFGVSLTGPARFDIAKLGAVLETAHSRLSGVVIERLPFAEVIRRYDRPGSLFYLDPPYWGGEKDYGAGVFHREDYARLASILSGIEGRFLLSLNDCPAVRETFTGFALEPVMTRYSISRGVTQAAMELLISNPVPRAS